MLSVIKKYWKHLRSTQSTLNYFKWKVLKKDETYHKNGLEGDQDRVDVPLPGLELILEFRDREFPSLILVGLIRKMAHHVLSQKSQRICLPAVGNSLTKHLKSGLESSKSDRKTDLNQTNKIRRRWFSGFFEAATIRPKFGFIEF